MPTYKTPGVYVEEISVFPPSVAEVETAIPAFVGYTEKTTYQSREYLNVPTEVSSLIEYEQIFGGGPSPKIIGIVTGADFAVEKVDFANEFYLYDSLRLFYSNGGGKCYIVAVDTYKKSGGVIDTTKLNEGLDALKKQDEPTLLLVPDAVLLPSNGLYDVQKHALQQAALLGDRFVIMDLLERGGWKKGVDDFRDNIGINYLKYGSAYTPHLKTTLPMTVFYRDLKGVTGFPNLRNLTTDGLIVKAINELEFAIDDVIAIGNFGIAELAAYLAKVMELQEELDKTPLPKPLPAFLELFKKAFTLVDMLDTLAKSTVTSQEVKKHLDAVLKTLEPTLTQLIAFGKIDQDEVDGDSGEVLGAPVGTNWGPAWVPGDPGPANSSDLFGDATTDVAKIRAAEPKITSLFKTFQQAILSVGTAAATIEDNAETALIQRFPPYQSLLAGIANFGNILPPSGAMAGIYATVDRTRGVWKAPANVSLNSVSGPTQVIDNADQDGLNVDAVAGKSINAIRPFTGKGILVWGARTLAGNSNEWRYINVRRFFNMVEESVKKSTSWAVFEGNDANLWSRLRGMIENYLTIKWREGALAGVKPEHAFFVHVGLGTTMTAQDILEGRLIIKIGMAAVRPAEFIVLQFQHKLQES